MPSLDLRDIEQVIHQIAESVDLAIHAVDKTEGLCITDTLESSSQEVGKPLERGHRGLQLVTGNPDKLIFAAFQFSAFADVTGNFGPANDPAGAIFDRGDTQGNLDERPIFSQAHRLIVIDSLALAQFCK